MIVNCHQNDCKFNDEEKNICEHPGHIVLEKPFHDEIIKQIPELADQLQCANYEKKENAL
jgi:hypothetical protein